MKQNNPIGIFDSGVGGLSIARSIQQTLPSENLLYVADLEFSPYGTKSKQLIENRSEYIVNFLFERGCKTIVVACNTATVNSIDKLRTKFDIPVVGVEPGIKPAALHSKIGVIGVLATEQTINSASFQALRDRFSSQVKIELQACPRLVELVENVNINSEETVKVVNDYVLPLILKGADHIVLGCTHYSFLLPVIEQVVGGKAIIVDTATPVAEELKRRLTHLDLLNPQQENGSVEFFSSHTSSNISQKISQLWGHKVEVLVI